MKDLEYREWISKYLDISHEILYLTQEECRNIGLSEKEILDLTEKAVIAYSKKAVDMPAKIGVHPTKDTFLHAMPVYIPDQFACGVKWGGSFPRNRERFSYPATSGLLIYNDPESGFPLAIMDAVYLTEIRTPAVALVSAKYCANLDAKTFGMISCGVQGTQEVNMISLVLTKLEKIYIYDIYEPAMDKLIKDIQPHINAKIVKAESLEDLVKNSEVIGSATGRPKNPVPKIKDELIIKGQTLLLTDQHRVYEDKTMKRADKYLVDSIETHEYFIKLGFYPYGLPEIYSEIGEVAAGVKKGRENKDELIVCNNIGMAVEDIIIARVIFDKALEKGMGIKLPL